MRQVEEKYRVEERYRVEESERVREQSIAFGLRGWRSLEVMSRPCRERDWERSKRQELRLQQHKSPS